jgi:hypothetical protein
MGSAAWQILPASSAAGCARTRSANAWSATRPRRKGYELPEVARVANSSGVVPAMGSWPERLLEVSASLRLAQVIFCFTLTGLAIGSIGEAKDVSLK